MFPPGREPGGAGEAEAVRDDDDDNGEGDRRGLALRSERHSGSESESEGSSWRSFWLSLIMTWSECGMAWRGATGVAVTVFEESAAAHVVAVTSDDGDPCFWSSPVAVRRGSRSSLPAIGGGLWR